MCLLSLFGAAQFGSWSITEMAVAIVVIAAIVALVYIALKQFGVAIPQWVIACFWVVVVALVVIACIRFVAGM
jgi:hypothetical protein